ncbi:hypothetical protein RYX36_020567, partial [Vicia faba]
MAVSFTRDSINQYLGSPLTFQAGKKCSYYKKVTSKMWNFYLVDVAHIIFQEMCSIVVSGYPFGSKVLTTLAYMSLIMGICRQTGVEIPLIVRKKIKSMVNEASIKLHCVPKLDGDRAPHPEEVAPPAGPV